MRLETLVCPNCSSPVEFDASTQVIHCRSCGSQSLVKLEMHRKPDDSSTEVPNQQSTEKIKNLLTLTSLQLSNGSFSSAHETCQTILQIEPAIAVAWAVSAVCKAQMARTEASERLKNLISIGFPSNRQSDEISRLRDIQENPLSEEMFKEITTAFALASDSEKPDIAKFFFNQKAILTNQLSDYECTREYGFSSDFPWEIMKYKILFLLREYGDQATSIEATKAFINIARNDLSLDRVPEPASVIGFWNDFRQRTWKSDEALEVWSLALGFVREQDPSFRPDLDRIFKYLRGRPKGAAVEESSLVVPARIISSTTQSPTNSPLVNTPTAWMASDYLYWIRWFLILVCTAFGLYFFTGVDSSFFRSLGAVLLCMFAIRSIAGAESRQESWLLGIAGAMVAVAWLIH